MGEGSFRETLELKVWGQAFEVNRKVWEALEYDREKGNGHLASKHAFLALFPVIYYIFLLTRLSFSCFLFCCCQNRYANTHTSIYTLYKTTHFSCMVHTLQSKVVGLN